MVRTIVWEANDEPPRFARAGALRWMRRNVVMKGVDPWAIFVRQGIALWRKELGIPVGLDDMIVLPINGIWVRGRVEFVGEVTTQEMFGSKGEFGSDSWVEYIFAMWRCRRESGGDSEPGDRLYWFSRIMPNNARTLQSNFLDFHPLWHQLHPRPVNLSIREFKFIIYRSVYHTFVLWIDYELQKVSK